MAIFDTPVGDQTRISDIRDGGILSLSVSALENGSAVVSWDFVDFGNPRQVYLQRLDGNGVELGGDLEITPGFGTSPNTSAIVPTTDGFAAIYQYFRSDRNTQDVAGQAFGFNGAPMGAEFGFRSDGYFSTGNLAAHDTAQGAIVTWTGTSSTEANVHLRRFDDSFAPTGADQAFGRPDSILDRDASAAARPDGIFATLWTASNVSTLSGDDAVTLRVFGADGTPQSRFVTVATSDDVQAHDIAALSDGTFVALWQDARVGLFVQRYDVNGAAVGAVIKVNTSAADFNNDARVAALPDGGFAVVWSDLVGRSYQILGQAFDAAGNPDGTEVRISDTSSSANDLPDVAVLEDGTLVVTWQTGPLGEETVTTRLFRDTAPTPVDPNAPTAGDDVIEGTDAPDAIDALAGNDRVSGLAGNDTLKGGAGDDTLDGGTGNDRMEGGPGNDSYRIDAAGDRIVEATGNGVDDVRATATVTLGGAEIEEVVLEGAGNLRVNGNGFAQEITGNAGSNILVGGGGADVLTGGAGRDFFVFQASDGDGPARITDFTRGQDRLALDDQLFGLGGTNIDPRDVTDQQATSALRSQSFSYDRGTGELRVDIDGRGGPTDPILIAVIEGGGPISQDDVLLF